MAVYNEILVARFNRALQKLTGIKGGAPVKQLGSEILPVFPIFWGVENRYLESWAKFGSTINLTGVAANNSAWRLRNPVGSNVIAVIENITLVNNNAGAAQYNLEGWIQTLTDLATDLTSFVTRFDARQGAAVFSTCKVSQQNTAPLAGIGNTPGLVNIFQTTTFPLITTDNQELPLLPGDAMQLRAPTVATGMQGFVWWRERFLEDSERS